MSRTMINFWLDALLLVLFLVLAWVSAVLQFLFPVGSSAADWVLWGWNVEQWREFQFGTVCALAAGIVLHLMLHWSWICGVVNTRLLGRKATRDDGTQTLIGVGILLLVLHMLGIGILAAWATIEAPPV